MKFRLWGGAVITSSRLSLLHSFPSFENQFWDFVFVKEQIDVSFLCVYPVIADKLRHTLSKLAEDPLQYLPRANISTALLIVTNITLMKVELFSP